jgi:hypothetical protein
MVVPAIAQLIPMNRNTKVLPSRLVFTASTPDNMRIYYGL